MCVLLGGQIRAKGSQRGFEVSERHAHHIFGAHERRAAVRAFWDASGAFALQCARQGHQALAFCDAAINVGAFCAVERAQRGQDAFYRRVRQSAAGCRLQRDENLSSVAAVRVADRIGG